MLSIIEETDSLNITMASRFEILEQALGECSQFLEQRNVSGNGEPLLVLREMLNNALEHGNQLDPDKRIHIRMVVMNPAVVSLSVQDEGPGFQLSDIPRPGGSDQEETSKGLALIRHYAEKIVFNETGNKVTAYIQPPRDISFDTAEHGDVFVVTPKTDLTSGAAPALRKVLGDGLGRGAGRYRLDLSQVQEVDSIALSALIGFAKDLLSTSPETRPEITGASRELQDVFRLTRLDDLYKVVPRPRNGREEELDEF
jgi:serine/threonine-protein kinase RsbW